jgi:hypothetical protein
MSDGVEKRENGHTETSLLLLSVTDYQGCEKPTGQ